MGLLSDVLRKYYFFKYNLIPFRARLIMNHAAKRALSLLGARKGFRIIDLALTYGCNLDCAHCSAMIMKKNEPSLTLDDYRKIVAEAKELDVLSWNITGGEPLLVPWLEDLIPILEPQRHYISVQTNCMALDEGKATRLKKLGVNCITTSLDSIDPDEHNSFRGSELSYGKVFEGLINARNAGMQVLVGGTITKQNIRSDGLVALIKKVNESGAIFLYNLAVPCGNWKDQEDIILGPEERKHLLLLLEKFPMSSTDHEVGRNAVGCPAGMEKVYITPYGDVIPCPFIHLSFGNIRRDRLKTIVDRMRTVPEFSKYQPICIAAEDREFQNSVMKRIYDSEHPCPVPYEMICRKDDPGQE